MVAKATYLSWIIVSDIQKARKFFKDLGMKELSFDEQFKWAEFQGKEGGALVGVAEKSDHDPEPAGGNAVITFSVDNMDKAKKELSSKGVKMLGDVLEVPGHVKMQTFADSDGNKFQIVENLDEDKK